MEEKIRAIMKAAGWTQQKVAEVFEVSQSTVNRWLSGSEPEGHRRDAINATYSQYVGDAADPKAGEDKIRDPDEIRRLLERIDGLKPDNVTVLLSAITGFQVVNGVQPLQAPPDDQSASATPRHESQSSR